MTRLSTILWHYGRTKFGTKFESRRQLESWQNQQVQRFLHQILPKSAFYRHHFASHSLAHWRTLPTINKAIMMANFDDLNTVGIHKAQAFELAQAAEQSRNFTATLKGCTIGLSSGTSGHRGLFLVHPSEQQTWAGVILAKALPKPIWIKQKISLFLRANSLLYETVQQRRIQFEYFDLLSPIPDHLQRLNAYQPDILVAPPSMLRILAHAQTQHRLDITPIKVVSVAEVLDPLDEKIIQSAFNQQVHQLYQCTEGFLGFTCQYGTLHLNEDNIVIQKDYLDVAQRKFSPIITDFRRTSQPIIRYRLDDILTERKTPCACGSLMTALEQIEGRQDDILYCLSQGSPSRLSQPDRYIPIFPDYIRRAILLATDDLTEYSVVQVQPDQLEISLQTNTADQRSIQNRISKQLSLLFKRLNVCPPAITYSIYTPRIKHHQKLRRVKRVFSIAPEIFNV